MKIILLLASFLIFVNSNNAQTITSFEKSSYYQGEPYMNSMIIRGNAIISPANQRVYGLYLLNQQLPGSFVALVDSNQYPNSSTSCLLNFDSIVVRNYEVPIPFDADTGMYDLALIICNNSPNPTSFITHTLINATRIVEPDAIVGGKTYIDRNLNGIYDASDTVVTFFHVALNATGELNIRHDSLGNYFFPLANGNHSLGCGFQTEYTLFSDSQFYSFNVQDTNILNLDFGFTEGLHECSPDTVYQNDTVTFHVSGNNVFFEYEIEHLFFLDSAGNGTSMSLNAIDSNVNIIDSNEVALRMIVDVAPGVYSFRVQYFYPQFRYNLPNALVVLPSTTNIVSQEDTPSFSAFPNPAYDFVHITSSINLNNFKYFIYDRIGTTVISGNERTNGNKINISNLTPGVYFLKIVSETSKWSLLKIIKI